MSCKISITKKLTFKRLETKKLTFKRLETKKLTFKRLETKKRNNNNEEEKQKIIKIFNDNIKNKEFDVVTSHCGSEGQLLEKMMGLKSNSRNAPDILGYEMKKDSNKITFGDFSASEYLFSKNNKYLPLLNGFDIKITRDDFIKTFGTPNPKKNNRYSWSGSCFPKYGHEWNSCGQRILFNDNNDLCIYYSYENDTRKLDIPPSLKNGIVMIAFWKKEKIKNHIEKKFNVNGFFILKKNKKGLYDRICFGSKIDYEIFMKFFRSRDVFLDNGMYQGNTRNYSQFRSSSSFWNKHIIEEYR